MKNMILIFNFLFLLFLVEPCAMAQCVDVPLADSSFEMGTLVNGGTFVPGRWYTDDGCMVSPGNAFSGDSSACSIGGGAFQVIPVDPNTTYHMSMYVRNGLNDPPLSFRINWIHYSFTVATNNWTLVSQSFNSGPDTTAIVGFYSAGACFDEVRVTCTPLTNTSTIQEPRKPFRIYPTLFTGNFTVESTRPISVRILSLEGREMSPSAFKVTNRSFGAAWPAGIYLLELRTAENVWHQKIVKQESH